jgi:hypothetical protein
MPLEVSHGEHAGAFGAVYFSRLPASLESQEA